VPQARAQPRLAFTRSHDCAGLAGEDCEGEGVAHAHGVDLTALHSGGMGASACTEPSAQAVL
jgi:hypothetical protein